VKIAQLNTHDSGGAGKAAVRLNAALNLIGEESKLFVKHKSFQHNDIIKIESTEIDNKLFNDIAHKYFINNIKPGNTISSLMYPSVGFKFLDVLRDFDIVNLHWISMFVSIEAIAKMRSMGKQLVWTLHDQNSFTGACHYTHGCLGYKTDCSACPQLVNNDFDITKYILQAKINNLPKDITIVTPSEWLADCARESALFKDYRVEVIPNSLETKIFKPFHKNVEKRALGLAEQTKVILFGAQELKESRKGLRYLLDSMKILKQNEYVQKLISRNEFCILVFGNHSPILDEMDLPYKALGYVDDDKQLSKIYSASDLLVLPSIEDNLPNLMLESLSCSTPVVGFSTGGIKDIIINGFNGYICNVGDTVSLAENILTVLKNGDALRENCRTFALEKFGLEIQGNKYRELYEDIIKSNSKVYSSASIPYMFPEAAASLVNYICESSIEIQLELNEKDRNYLILKNENDSNLHEKNKLQQEKDNIIVEKDQLQLQKDLLINERDGLQQSNDLLNKALKELQQAINELQQEKQSVIQENNELLQENDLIYKKIENLELERETIGNELDLLNVEKESLLNENDTLIGEKKTVLEELQQVYGSRSWKVTKPLRFIGKHLK